MNLQLILLRKKFAMATFTKEINGMQFNFQPLEFGENNGYHVDVKDSEGTRWEFSVFAASAEEMKIEAEKLPNWISDYEKDILKAIDEHD